MSSSWAGTSSGSSQHLQLLQQQQRQQQQLIQQQYGISQTSAAVFPSQQYYQEQQQQQQQPSSVLPSTASSSSSSSAASVSATTPSASSVSTASSSNGTGSLLLGHGQALPQQQLLQDNAASRGIAAGNTPSYAQIKKMLDDNHCFIMAALDCMKSGRADDSVAFQRRVIENLLFLANFVDAPSVLAKTHAAQIQQYLQVVPAGAGGTASAAGSMGGAAAYYPMTHQQLSFVEQNPPAWAAIAMQQQQQQPKPVHGASSNTPDLNAVAAAAAAMGGNAGTGADHSLSSVFMASGGCRSQSGSNHSTSSTNGTAFAAVSSSFVLGPPIPKPMQEQFRSDPQLSLFLWSDAEHERLRHALEILQIPATDWHRLAGAVGSRDAVQVQGYIEFQKVLYSA